ncbi:hypothetical protein E4U42_002545 [Claviceps africana]|uniref:Uncharacterized protein n=1 Tax=Claviceps africana TaxID=83212 RepID=A0A8K0NJM8_9HYPO|nr:hypothetical protein E4U42_002545 [Claviceps africana]
MAQAHLCPTASDLANRQHLDLDLDLEVAVQACRQPATILEGEVSSGRVGAPSRIPKVRPMSSQPFNARRMHGLAVPPTRGNTRDKTRGNR